MVEIVEPITRAIRMASSLGEFLMYQAEFH